MSRPNPIDRSPTHLLHRAGQSVADLFAKEIKSDLTPRQLTVLRAIAQNVGCSQSAIVERTGIDRSTIAEMVRRLVKKGIIGRRRSRHDTRAYILTLTEAGQRLLKEAEPLAKHVDDKILRVLGGHGATFVGILAALIAQLEASS